MIMKTIIKNTTKLPANIFEILHIIGVSLERQVYKILEIFIGDNITEKKLQGEIFTNPILVPVKRKE